MLDLRCLSGDFQDRFINATVHGEPVMRPLAALLIAGCLCLGGLPAQAQAQAQDKAPGAQPAPASQGESFRPSEITFFGKLYSPLKLSVFLPYTAKITDVAAQIGHKVKRGDILATYEIPLDTRMEQRTNLAPTTIKDLEYRISVADKELDRLAAKARELDAMSQRSMASQQSLSLNAKEIEVYRKEKSSLTEQLALARELLADRVGTGRRTLRQGLGRGQGAQGRPDQGPPATATCCGSTRPCAAASSCPGRPN